MRRTQSSLLLGIVVAASAIALAACCKDKTEEAPEEVPAPATSETATAEPAPVLEASDPDWKTKCPDAERPESGTVTALRSLQIFKKPDSTSEKASSIGPGTWVNLLGAKGTWYCIDYPCGVAQLCPGWIEARYSKRKEPERDAGKPVVDAGTKDAAAEVKDAAAEVKDAASGRRIRVPNLRFTDAGKTGTTTGDTKRDPPPGPGRPPAIAIPKPQ